jgi:predicted SprT family Zn-dependent metalloprotease
MGKMDKRIKGVSASVEMNDQIFGLRRRVMDALYAAKRVIGRELPRVHVRIMEFERERTLGVAWLGADRMGISAEAVGWDDEKLTAVVWHELAHAWFGAEHDEECPLMQSTYRAHARKYLERALVRIANKNKEARRERRA